VKKQERADDNAMMMRANWSIVREINYPAEGSPLGSRDIIDHEERSSRSAGIAR